MYSIEFSSRKAARLLFTVLGILVVLHLTVAFCHLVLHWKVAALTQLVDLDLESNVPTFFNALLFFIAAALFYMHGNAALPKMRMGWYVMTGVFVFLGFDEGSQIHEKFMLFTLRLLNNGKQTGGDLGWFYYAWVIPYGLAVIGLGLVLSRWLFGLRPAVRRSLILSGAVYVFGAVFMEMAGAKLVRTLPFQDASLFPWIPCEVYEDPTSCWMYMNVRYISLYTLEETLEMTGLILCIHYLLKAFETNRMKVSVLLSPRDEGNSASD
ncbi:MAG: hypothetical protein IPO60_17360 [Flavobacteriales bacterium]|jgi:hypothetical protein|nr:hypothetical protein [Flavobacteriales bacterium]MBK6893338.1 hypothetical protein [Flavobacteriales bacterium]MBK7248935.1 hypothetical protein [Flavobacteriales bacterium]MBK9058825.1 hypothetical protein [Flavobacteriales bacterium]MBK9600033.1 hypothetical protein [Flavobacteriales bacterium]